MHRTRRYWPRWLLLAAVVCGVAGMHTLGHPHEAATAPTPSGHHAAAEETHVASGSPTGEVNGAHVPMGPMCLAVLTAGLLLLSAGLSTSRHRKVPAPQRRAHRCATPHPRGPPNLVPVGLTLNRITVLRI